MDISDVRRFRENSHSGSLVISGDISDNVVNASSGERVEAILNFLSAFCL